MTDVSIKIAEMVDILPESDQQLAYTIIQKLVRAWDPDFTKLTPLEAKQLAEAEERYNNGETFTMDEVDWD